LGVGATIFKEFSGRIVSSAFNSKPHNSKNYLDCVNPITGRSQEDLIHAEIKAIVLGGLNNLTDIGRDCIAVTSAPCVRCGGVIALSKMKEVFYLEPHDELEGVRVLQEDYGIKSTDLSEYRSYISSLRDHAEKLIKDLEFS